MVTSHDVARLAGVSQATVSRAMDPTSKVSAETRQRVRHAMDALGYVPNAAAQSLRGQRTGIVGVVIEEVSNPFYSEVLDELTRALGAAGYRSLTWNAGGGSHADALSAIRERTVDGVILTTATERTPELQAALEGSSPLVLINRTVDGAECDVVVSENRRGGALVAQFLATNGRVRPALISGSPGASTSAERAGGFIEELAAAGVALPDHLVFSGAFSHDAAESIATRLLSRADWPDAIFCANDYMAFGVLDAIRRRGDERPSPWVIGYDDVELASWPAFDLTTVRQPSRAMARAGVDLLLERIAAPERPPRTVLFPCELIVRGSTPGAC